MKEIHKECGGCKSFNGECTAGVEPHLDSIDYTRLNIKDHDCPCLNCLVKGICTELCDDFRKYQNVYIDIAWGLT